MAVSIAATAEQRGLKGTVPDMTNHSCSGSYLLLCWRFILHYVWIQRSKFELNLFSFFDRRPYLDLGRHLLFTERWKGSNSLQFNHMSLVRLLWLKPWHIWFIRMKYWNRIILTLIAPCQLPSWIDSAQSPQFSQFSIRSLYLVKDPQQTRPHTPAFEHTFSNCSRCYTKLGYSSASHGWAHTNNHPRT